MGQVAQVAQVAQVTQVTQVAQVARSGFKVSRFQSFKVEGQEPGQDQVPSRRCSAVRLEMDALRYRDLSFKPLKEDDLPVLYGWLQAPHVREFYHRKSVPGWEEMRAEYLQRLDPGWPTRCFVCCFGSTPLGYIQTYRVADYPEYAAMIGEERGISLDLFIADAAHIGNGWGRLVLLKFLRDVAFPMFGEEHVCWIYHDKRNHRALRASRAAGFRHVRHFIEDGDPKELLALQRDEVCATRIDR